MIDRRRFLGGAALGLASARSTFGQEPKDTPQPPIEADPRVVRILEQARGDGRRLPGMVGAVVRKGELAAIGAVGVRKAGSPNPIRVGDKVHLGSCTKAMTATMIGTVVDAGKIRWDSTIAEVFPDRAAKIHPDFRGVTLTDLLHHRAGLPGDVEWWNLGQGLTPTDQRRALLARVLRDPPLTKPGTTQSYSNVSYALAGLMAEQVTRTPWDRLMRDRIFRPLGMASAGFGPPGKAGGVDQPWGHKIDGAETRAIHADNPPSMGPAATVHCSVPDWARFAALHLGHDPGGDRPILKPETLKALHTPSEGGDYAGGWIACERSWAGGTAFNHAGSNTYWFCNIWIAPGRDLALLVATNAAGDEARAGTEQATTGLLRAEEKGGLSRG